MLYQKKELPLDSSTWRRINMRKVDHLIGAEMIHNLYSRYWPYINSLHFRHTITNFKNGIVESYAPTNEWSYLQKWLSKKFLSLDDVLLREIEAILNPNYTFVEDLMKKVDSSDIKALSDDELALLLIDVMDIPLGDIYKLNVVQIEYSLTHALHQILEKYEPSEIDRNELLSRIISPGELTIAQKEEVAFSSIVFIGRENMCSNPIDNNSILALLENHHKQYAPSHCAYGELPPTIEEYINKYELLYPTQNKLTTIEAAKHEVEDQKRISSSILKKINDDKLNRLCKLMAKIGVFRDHNKAKLGETVVRRLYILDEIARRKNISRDHLNYYLISEIAALLDTNEMLSKRNLDSRTRNGVSFIRNEDLIIKTLPIRPKNNKMKHPESLYGICASPGLIEGVAKVIYSKNDIHKMMPGDIMIAIGTDFDLLEVMHLAHGIITEEGGLLSHASVVSRELKKPCIIGVENATKILQDGDKIKLDASSGAVYVIDKVSKK